MWVRAEAELQTARVFCLGLSPCASSHLSPTWTRLGFPAACPAMWRTHAGAVCSAEPQTGARHGMNLPPFHPVAPRSLPLPLTFTPALPQTPSTSRPVFLSLPGRARLRRSPDSEPRHSLYPAEITWTLVCFCHVHAILFQLAESRLTSRSTTTTPPQQQPPSLSGCALLANKAADNIVITTREQRGGRFRFSAWTACRCWGSVSGWFRRWPPVCCWQGPKGKSDVGGVRGCVMVHSSVLVKERGLRHKSAHSRS